MTSSLTDGHLSMLADACRSEESLSKSARQNNSSRLSFHLTADKTDIVSCCEGYNERWIDS
jgi:hypothetical protein